MVNSNFLAFSLILATAGSAAGATLGLTFGGKEVSRPGENIRRQDTADPPEVSTPVWTSAGRGILLMVDVDVPRNGSRVQLLHWLVSNVTLEGKDSLVIPNEAEAPYRQPSPPTGDIAHAYHFSLYEQPDNFSVPEEFRGLLESRVFFNTSAFLGAAGLRDPIAGNFIRVQNTTDNSPSSSSSTRSAAATAAEESGSTQTGDPETGDAPRAVTGGDRVFWAGVAGSVVAGVAAFAL